MLVLALSACEVERAPAPTDTADACAGAPTYAGWAVGFFTTWCRSCHSESAADRREAPEGVDFDSAAQIAEHAARVRARVIDEGTMPVGGGLSGDDLAMLDRYLTCGGEGDAGRIVTDPGAGGELDADEVAERVDGAIAAGIPRAEEVWLAYLELLYDHAQLDCPGGWNDELQDYDSTMAGCETDEGWTFAGVTFREREVDGEGTREWMLGDGFVLSPDGDRGVLGGEIEWWRSHDGEWWSTVDGTWGWEWEAGWLEHTPSIAISISGEWEGREVTATLDGGLTLDGASVYFTAVAFDTNECAAAPVSGAVSVRDDDGDWYTMTLAGDCSGCGDGELGEVCLDWSATVASLDEIPT